MQTRRLQRHNLIFYLRVFERSSGKPLGFLGDVTPEGVLVVGESPIDPGRDIELEIQDHTAPEDEPIVVKGASVWCKTDVNPHYYATGFRLYEVPSRSQRAIRSLIREMGFGAAGSGAP